MFVTGRRYRAPAGDGDQLIDPPLADVPGLLQSAKQVDLSHQSFGGMSLSQWRQSARLEVLKLLNHQAQPSAWFMAGHQPELFHPGVWLKNFILGRLAKQHQGIGINLIVDNDVPKSAAVRVPEWRPGIAATDVAVANVPYDLPSRDVPFEELQVNDATLWASFPDRLRAATKDWPEPPIGVPGWDHHAINMGDALTALRRQQEQRWGLHNAELKVSQLCNTEAFSHFSNTLIADLPRFHACYNSAVHINRVANRIKSRHHPVPDLATDGDWLEAPFWCWTSNEPRRVRPFFRRTRDGLRLRWGKHESAWPNKDIKLRPRALTLTMFARLALADAFIHGIGGGKYDELTDDICRSYIGIAPPTYMVVTGTLRLNLPRFNSTNTDWMEAQRQARDLQWNPQRLVTSPELAAERTRLLAMPNATKVERRDRYNQLRRNLARWQNQIAAQRTTAHERLHRLDAEDRANVILGSREWAWVLHSEERLCRWLVVAQVPTKK